MILNCKLSVSRSTGAHIMSLVKDGVTYFKTLGDTDGIKRLRDWAGTNGFLIDSRTLPVVR